jgi:5-(carboxyamino)imidazole ribonucleotide mutase
MRKKHSIPPVAVLMGSDSDWKTVKETVGTLDAFGVASDVRVISAHRTPRQAAAYAKSAAGRGIQVIIAAAGGAAHLAGVLASHTTLPVIGIPMQAGDLEGFDALLATVQMPAGIPVATVALGRAGVVNAALLAIQILALSRSDLKRRLLRHKMNLEKKVIEGDKRVRAEQEKKA